jgi:hypothetical protein
MRDYHRATRAAPPLPDPPFSPVPRLTERTGRHSQAETTCYRWTIIGAEGSILNRGCSSVVTQL